MINNKKYPKPDPEKILEDVMKNKRVASRIEELNLTKDQMIDALPILIDMASEEDAPGVKFLTSFYISDDKYVQRSKVKSSWFERFSYLDNIITQDISYVDFEDEKEFIKEPSRATIVNYMSKYIKNAGTYTKGMYIHGAMGIGKTFILKRMAKKLATKNKEVGFLVVQDLVQKVKSSFKSEESHNELINKIKNVDYLFIDDIGAEQITSWFRDDVLFSILNYRMDKQKTTFFSSNYSYKELEDIQSKTSNSKIRDKDKAARLLSRIQSLTENFVMTGSNKR